jgi:hypothetical protein
MLRAPSAPLLTWQLAMHGEMIRQAHRFATGACEQPRKTRRCVPRGLVLQRLQLLALLAHRFFAFALLPW